MLYSEARFRKPAPPYGQSASQPQIALLEMRPGAGSVRRWSRDRRTRCNLRCWHCGIRIELFKESIGDLEPIVGERTDELVGLLLNPELTPAEREQKAEEVCQALENNRVQQQELEDNASDLVGLSTSYCSRLTTRDGAGTG